MSHADSHPPGRPPGFLYHPGRDFQQLQCEARPLSALGKRFGTPLYIYSAKTIRRRLRDFDQAFGDYPHTICYSVKANSNIHILRLLAKMGCAFDVVSGGELERVLRADRRAARSVVFSGVGKTPDEMRAALNAGILLFNVESESELEVLAACAARLHKPARMALRVNPDVPAETHPYISTGLHQHKFGVPIRQAPELYHRAAKSKFLRAAGVSVHIGSQITDVSPFRASMERVANLVLGLRRAGHDIRYVDAGGGLGIAYKDQSPPDFSARVRFYADALLGPLRNLDIQLLLEPGRSIVGPAGVLLTRVLYKKTNNARTFVVVDAAMNDLLRPALYQAYHEIVPVKTGHSYEEVVDVVGPVCETGDFFARDRKLGLVNQGDLLAILDAGAYGMSLASNYNTRPRAAEILVDGKRARLIRKRESTEYLLRLE